MSEALPFDLYPDGGRVLLGRPTGCNSRYEYGLQVLQATGQTTCAYCGESVVDTLRHWLSWDRDHVVPVKVCTRLGIPDYLVDDVINMVIACRACNSWKNRYTPSWVELPSEWTLDGFLALRDRIFRERYEIVAQCRATEKAHYLDRPWEKPPSRLRPPMKPFEE